MHACHKFHQTITRITTTKKKTKTNNNCNLQVQWVSEIEAAREVVGVGGGVRGAEGVLVLSMAN